MGGAKSTLIADTTYVSVFESLNRSFIQQNTVLKSTVDSVKVIRNVVFLPTPGCTNQNAKLVITQQDKIGSLVISALEHIRSDEVSREVARTVEASLKNQFDREKTGTFAISDATQNTQKWKLTDITVSKIQQDIEYHIDKHVSARSSSTMINESNVFYIPCGGAELTQYSVMETIVDEMTKTVTKTVTEASEVTSLDLDMENKDKGKATDTIAAVAEAIGEMFSSAIFMVILFVIILVVGGILVLKVLVGGGGSSGESDKGA